MMEKAALLVPLGFSLSLHELAHARTALAFGDPTARDMGRCTINPLAHLDPIGTLALVLVGFGWAKPVPVNVHNLHPPKWGGIAVSVAGPLSNLMLAVITGLLLRLMVASPGFVASRVGDAVFQVAVFTMAANLCLFVFNMVPLYPLDGHHIFRDHLPADMQAGFMRWQLQYGRFALLALIFAPRLLANTKLSFLDPMGWVFKHALATAVRVLVL